MRVLVIGGAGFIGGHLIQKILADNKVKNIDIVDNFSRAKKDSFFKKILLNKKITLIKENIITMNVNKLTYKKYDLIFQFAAILGVSNVMKYPLKVLQENFEMMKKSIDLAKNQKKLKKIIFLSTSEVYAGALENFKIKFPTPETSPLALTNLSNSRTSYMLSKIYCEAMCIHSGLPYLILRPHNIYGPRMGFSHVIPELLKKIEKIPKKKYLNLNSYNHKRAFCFVDDAISQIYSVTKSKIVNQTFNIGNSTEEISMHNLCKKILKISSRKDIVIKKKFIKNFSPIRRLPDMRNLFKHIKKIKFTKLEVGIKKTFEWYERN
jgi:UDP-glucose 4-epimerase